MKSFKNEKIIRTVLLLTCIITVYKITSTAELLHDADGCRIYHQVQHVVGNLTYDLIFIECYPSLTCKPDVKMKNNDSCKDPTTCSSSVVLIRRCNRTHDGMY